MRQFSPQASVFLLVHKMDLVQAQIRPGVLDKKRRDLEAESGDQSVTVFGTSIYDDTLYKARTCHPLRFWP